jgi:hypothetical protein
MTRRKSEDQKIAALLRNRVLPVLRRLRDNALAGRLDREFVHELIAFDRATASKLGLDDVIEALDELSATLNASAAARHN